MMFWCCVLFRVACLTLATGRAATSRWMWTWPVGCPVELLPGEVILFAADPSFTHAAPLSLPPAESFYDGHARKSQGQLNTVASYFCLFLADKNMLGKILGARMEVCN